MRNTVAYSGPADGYGKVMTAGRAVTVLDIPSEDEIVRIGDNDVSQNAEL
jgi:hypothetical protein